MEEFTCSKLNSQGAESRWFRGGTEEHLLCINGRSFWRGFQWTERLHFVQQKRHRFVCLQGSWKVTKLAPSRKHFDPSCQGINQLGVFSLKNLSYTPLIGHLLQVILKSAVITEIQAKLFIQMQFHYQGSEDRGSHLQG